MPTGRYPFMTKPRSIFRRARTSVLVVLSIALFDGVLTRLVLPDDLFGLIGTERLARIYSPVYHHDLAPNRLVADARWGTVRYSFATNSLGLKDRAVRPVPQHADRPRLLFMGDSFVEGNGTDFDHSVPGQVEKILADLNVEVLNAAVSSYSPAIYYRKTKHLIEDRGLEIDAVAVFVDISDIDDEARGVRLDADDNVISRGTGPMDEWTQKAVLRTRGFLKRNSSVYRLVSALNRERKARITHAGNCLDALAADDPAQPLDAAFFRAQLANPRSQWTWNDALHKDWGQQGLDTAAANMAKLEAFLSSRGIPLIVAVYPWPEQIFQGETDSRQSRFWRRWARNNGAHFLDLFPVFGHGLEPLAAYRKYFVLCDVHWNAAGHELVARTFAGFYRSLDARAVPAQGQAATEIHPDHADPGAARP